MESIECWSINNSRLMADKDALHVLERVEHDRSCVAQLDLEDRIAILLPPALTYCSVIIAELQQVTKKRNGPWYLWYTPNVRNVSSC